MLARSMQGETPMRKSNLLMLAFAAGIAVLPSLAAADARVTLSPDAVAAHKAAGAALHLQTQRAVVAPQRAATASTDAMGTFTQPGTPMANAYRAYPPSCAADPLPNAVSGPYSIGTVTLYATTPQGLATSENVTVTIWRIACSSSGTPTAYNPVGAYNAMTLLRIDRDPSNEGRTDVYPLFPYVMASQNGSAFGTTASLVRMAVEPNTVISDTTFDTPLYSSTTYVLENYPYTGSGYFTFGDAFTLRIDPFISGVRPFDFTMPTYNPTQSTYPAAFNPLYLDGYAAAQWYNTTFNEGLIMQVAEGYDSSHPTRRQVIFDLLTLDTNSNPLWLVGSAAFEVGTTNLTMSLSYLGKNNQTLPWGSATMNVQDCNHLNVTYTPNANLPAPIPSISGLTVYNRIFSANGMLCE